MSTPEKQYSATEAATLLLIEYREHRQTFRVFDDFENAMTQMRESAERGLCDLDEPLKTVAERLLKICNDGFFLVQVCEWKISYIAEALVHSIERQNPISLANNARALIEHVAALVFIFESLEKLRANLAGQGSELKINEALCKAELTLKRCYYGKSPKLAEKDGAAPHIESECLKAFEHFVPDIFETYGFLCEYVHPNFGSNLLVSTGELGRGRLNPPADFHRDALDRICRYCSLTMLFLRKQPVQLSTPIVQLKDLADRCLAPGVKITSVFAQRAAAPRGDGQSKETAFFFPKARTNIEAVEMSYRYLDEAGIKVLGNKEIGAVADGFIYDVYPTSGGRLWFKIPAMKF